MTAIEDTLDALQTLISSATPGPRTVVVVEKAHEFWWADGHYAVRDEFGNDLAVISSDDYGAEGTVRTAADMALFKLSPSVLQAALVLAKAARRLTLGYSPFAGESVVSLAELADALDAFVARAEEGMRTE